MGQLAAAIRKKYPGAYDDVSDAELEEAARRKYPGAYEAGPEPTAPPLGTRVGPPRDQVQPNRPGIDLTRPVKVGQPGDILAARPPDQPGKVNLSPIAPLAGNIQNPLAPRQVMPPEKPYPGPMAEKPPSGWEILQTPLWKVSEGVPGAPGDKEILEAFRKESPVLGTIAETLARFGHETTTPASIYSTALGGVHRYAPRAFTGIPTVLKAIGVPMGGYQAAHGAGKLADENLSGPERATGLFDIAMGYAGASPYFKGPKETILPDIIPPEPTPAGSTSGARRPGPLPTYRSGVGSEFGDTFRPGGMGQFGPIPTIPPRAGNIPGATATATGAPSEILPAGAPQTIERPPTPEAITPTRTGAPSGLIVPPISSVQTVEGGPLAPTPVRTGTGTPTDLMVPEIPSTQTVESTQAVEVPSATSTGAPPELRTGPTWQGWGAQTTAPLPKPKTAPKITPEGEVVQEPITETPKSETPALTLKVASEKFLKIVQKFELSGKLEPAEIAQFAELLKTPNILRGRSKPFLAEVEKIKWIAEHSETNMQGGLGAIDPREWLRTIGPLKEFIRGLPFGQHQSYNRRLQRARELANSPKMLSDSERKELWGIANDLRVHPDVPDDLKTSLDAKIGPVKISRKVVRPSQAQPTIEPIGDRLSLADTPRIPETSRPSTMPPISGGGTEFSKYMAPTSVPGETFNQFVQRYMRLSTDEFNNLPGETRIRALDAYRMSQDPSKVTPFPDKPTTVTKPTKAPEPILAAEPSEPAAAQQQVVEESRKPGIGKPKIPTEKPAKVQTGPSKFNLAMWPKLIHNDVIKPWLARVAELDAAKAPDSAYASIDIRTKAPLGQGETYRERVLNAAGEIEGRSNPKFHEQLLANMNSVGRGGTTLHSGFDPKLDTFLTWLRGRPSGGGLNLNEPGIARQIYDLTRGLTTVDLPYLTSAAFRQGLPDFGTKNWMKAYSQSVQAYGDKATGKMILAGIRNNPLFKQAEAAGIDFTDIVGIGAREEGIRGQLAERIPIYGPHVAKSNLSYTVFMNSLRMSKFSDLVNLMSAQNNPLLQKQIARFINNTTGRGTIAGMGRNSQILNDVFFSPQLQMSHMQMFNPANYLSGKIHPVLRQQQMASALRMAGAAASFLWLAKFAGAEVNLDPTNSDFLKAKFGDTRIDVLGGKQQYMVLVARLLSGGITPSTRPGEFIPYGGGGPFDPSPGKTLGQFTVNRLHPTASLFYELINASQDQPMHLTDEMIQRIAPLFLSDLAAIAKEHPELVIPYGLAASSGMGTQTYEGYDPDKLAYPFIPESMQMNWTNQYNLFNR